MNKRMTNEEFVSDLMNYSPCGALCRVFIIVAIRHYSFRCSKEPAFTFDSPFLSGLAWIGVAKDIHAKVEAKCGPSHTTEDKS